MSLFTLETHEKETLTHITIFDLRDIVIVVFDYDKEKDSWVSKIYFMSGNNITITLRKEAKDKLLKELFKTKR